MITPAPATTHECDAVIVGAGPAGCAVATVLAEAGRRVIVLERDRFPRYRIGESLIPFCWFPLERLGVNDRLADAGYVVEKRSVQFVGTEGDQVTPFHFSQHTDHECARTWQVRRGDFDRMLLDNAVERGAEAFLDTTARALRTDGDRVTGVRAVTAAGEPLEIRAPMTIDASGRDLFTMSQTDWRVPDPFLRKIAIWTYVRGARRDCGVDAGATTVAYLPDKGWFWFIPLPDDIVSVGVVAERDYLYRGPRDPRAIFEREVAAQPWIRDRLAPGERTEDFRVTGDYSYRSRYCARDGLLLVGDAFAFLDPVFSSGVLLALQSGVMAGDAVEAALAAGDASAARFADYGDRLCRSIEAMRRLVFAFYDTAFSFGRLMKARPDLRSDLTDCLIGNLDRDYTALFEAVAELARVPEPLSYGRPLITDAAAP
ncbi:MAG: NAD(P)/FAD-dependent oxidoreductase [Planctomycetota bacterium]|jgi:flavin-dependent dehydrogenase